MTFAKKMLEKLMYKFVWPKVENGGSMIAIYL